MANPPIQARTLKGFRDITPPAMRRRNAIVALAQKTLELHSFQPIATPVLEYTEILLGKGAGETEKQVYRFQDAGERDVAMRYDLTVPLARYAAQHRAEMTFPFKAYQIGLVWRGENAQRGRYREFMQCDFDILGTDSAVADAEVLAVAAKLVGSFFGEGFALHVNSRGLLRRFLEHTAPEADMVVVLRSLDKLRKIGAEKVIAEMGQYTNVSPEQAQALLSMAALQGSPSFIKAELENLVSGAAEWPELDRLLTTVNLAYASGVSEQQIAIDLSIARGLDYYTGLVFETFATATPEVGSICSGGRYNNLTGLYGEQTPGVGGSVGVDRLMSLLEPEAVPAATVVILNMGVTEPLFRIATALRDANISCEVYPEDRKLKQQLKYADTVGATFAVIAGSSELERNQCQVKNLKTGEAFDVALLECATKVAELLRATA
jgi:histidyl-tRNA synthetase